MTEEMIALGRRAVACKGWRWLPGMLWHAGDALTGEPWEGRIGDNHSAREVTNTSIFTGARPDLTDPATLGCLLALVREAWEHDTAYACDFDGYDAMQWVVVVEFATRLPPRDSVTSDAPGVYYVHGNTEAAALVAALEAAP